jgi:hypothetical protein
MSPIIPTNLKITIKQFQGFSVTLMTATSQLLVGFAEKGDSTLPRYYKTSKSVITEIMLLSSGRSLDRKK